MSDCDSTEANEATKNTESIVEQTSEPNKSFDPSTYKPCMRFLLQSKNVGQLIGFRGQNLKRLQIQFQSNVTIAEGNTPERIVVIEPNDSSLIKSLRQIIESLTDYNSANSSIEIKPLIHQSQIKVFTPEQLEKISINSNCQLKLAENNCPNSNERVLSLKGTVDQILLSIHIIQDIFLNNPPEGEENFYIPQKLSTVAVEEYLGWDSKEGFGEKPISKKQKAKEKKLESVKRKNEEEDPLSTMKIGMPSDLSSAAFGNDGKRLARMRKESGADVIVSDGDVKDELVIAMSGTTAEIKHARRMLEDFIWFYSS